MMKLKPLAILLFLVVPISSVVFGQDPEPAIQEPQQGKGITLEYGIALNMSTTPEIEFSDLRSLEGYKGKLFLDSYNYRARIHLGDSTEVWFSRTKLTYEKDEDQAKQSNGSVVSEKGKIFSESDKLEIPFFYEENPELLNAHISIGAGVVKFAYDTELEGTTFKDEDYMRLYTVGAGLHFQITDEYNVYLYYNYDFIDTADNFEFRLTTIMLNFGYRLF